MDATPVLSLLQPEFDASGLDVSNKQLMHTWKKVDSVHTEAQLMSPCAVQAQLHGVVPVQQHAFQAMQQRAVQWSNRLIQAAAVCHGLTMVNKTTGR